MGIEQELKIGEIWSKTPTFKAKEQKAIDALNIFFDLSKNPYLALSWGKQSICLAHMIYQIAPDTKMIFMRSWESFLYHDFERVINEFINNFHINYVDYYKDNVSWNSLSWKETRDLGQNDLQNMAEEIYPSWDGVIMGLAKDESKARRITTSLRTTEWDTIFKYKTKKYRVTPIQDWNNKDLAAYIFKYKIPLLSAYNEGLHIRTTARITSKSADFNGMKGLKYRNMTAYNLIINRFPELSVK